ncbi:winged helix-turn-helix transcriptional regulator [uncultured Limosilactobacillus sp.]|uniref:winged helix-turn-helix transcriptional regulator n=1 Tax=uncultured Limosilactobacillus sp. TaxID=2837629 RepID=UPI002599708D|nr:winged helix-turn-helix transcriptional regulator [uncultured Limosilactobacillus sp.]
MRNVNFENHDQVTKKVLSQQLKALIAAGIVNRTIIPTMLPQTQYALTPVGKQIRELMVKLSLAGEQLVKENNPQVTIEYSYGCIGEPGLHPRKE